MTIHETVEPLAGEVGESPDVEELLGEMLDLHGEGLARIFEALAGEAEIRETLVADPVVSSMLLVHGLHPVPLEERVAAALDSVRPYLASHGGDVALVALDDGVARLRLQGTCNGCAASASTLELAIEGALEQEAPDLLGLEVEGAVERPRTPGKLLPVLGSASTGWTDVSALPEPGALALVGPELVVANVAGTLLAYRDACAGCGSSLADGDLEAGVVTCPSCARQFALTLAGRSIGPGDLQLEPVPLLEREGRVTVAGTA